MRHWIILSNLGQIRLGSDNEGHLARIFIDTGANCNTITRKFYSTLLDQGLKCAFYPGILGGIDIYLVGGQRLGVSGDKTTLTTELKTNLGGAFIPNNFKSWTKTGKIWFWENWEIVHYRYSGQFFQISWTISGAKHDSQGVRSRASSMCINFRGS